jgi:hypothetical protein
VSLQVVYLAHDYFPSLSGKEGGCDRPLTALPYCDGDYWPGMAETFAQQLKEGTLVLPPPEKRTNPHLEGITTPGGPPALPGMPATAAAVVATSGSAAMTDDPDFKDGGGDSPSAAAAAAAAVPSQFSAGEGLPGLAVVPAAPLLLPGDFASDGTGHLQGGGDAHSAGVASGKGQKGKKGGKGRGAGRGSRGGASMRGGGKGTRPVIGAVGLDGSPARRPEVFGPDGRPLAYDPVRDKIAEVLTGSMERDFIVVKLRPSCQLCKRFITGAGGMQIKHRCKQCCQQVGRQPL